MLHLLLLIISYGSFLLLIMPTTVAGIVSTVVLLALGIGLMVYKKVHQICFWKSKHYLLIAVTILIAGYFRPTFYIRWLFSSKMQAIATLLHMSVQTMLTIGSYTLAVLSVYFIYAGLQLIHGKLSDTDPRNNFKRSMLTCILAAAVTVALAQLMIDTDVIGMGCFKFAAATLIIFTVIALLLSLLKRVMPSILIGTGIFMVISTVNVYVYSFRGRLFEPLDVFSAGTAMNVMGNYSLFPVPFGICLGWGVFIAAMVALYRLQSKKDSGITPKKRLALLIFCAISSVSIFFYTSGLKTYHWDKEGALFNGYYLDFVAKFKEISVPEPDNYSTELIADLAAQYPAEDNATSQLPHLIVIMDEAFSDLSVAGEFSTNQEVAPFVSSLKENTISGYALASVYGGNTANSEYEFLTGNSLAWLSPNVVPYQQYVRSSTYSMVSYLKSSFGYNCIALHPYLSSGWNRPLAYEHLGFDESHFVEDFPQQNLVRDFVSDQESFEYLIETFEAHKDEPLFIFNVTMQNHGDYRYRGDNFTQHISLHGLDKAFPEIEQYLSLVHETDKAVEYLITYFQTVDEDVVIVFFGDHQPRIDDSFYGAINPAAADTLDQRQNRYKVPFFIWANYDIEEQYIDCTSLNYLSSYVYDTAGIPLPPYNQFLREMEAVIPSINANGYYSSASGCYLTLEEANEAEQHWLELYEALQYNNIFDKAHRNNDLFPVLE